jgi:hypothetical protein
MLACDGVCVRVGVRRGEEVVTPNLAPSDQKQKRGHSSEHTPLGLSPELGIKFVRVCTGFESTTAAQKNHSFRPRFLSYVYSHLQNTLNSPKIRRVYRVRTDDRGAMKNHSFFRPRFLSHFAGSTTTGKTTSRNASFPRKLPVTVSRSERASTALHAARSFHRRAPASRHRAYRRRTRDRCVPPGERRPRRRAPAERRAARASRPDRDHSERRIVLSRLERTGRAAA